MRSRHLLPLLLLLPACSNSSIGGQTGEESAGCVRVVDTVLAEGDTTPLGIGGSDVVATMSVPHVTSLWWSDGGERRSDGTKTPVQFTFTASSEPAHYVEEEMDGGDGRQEIALDCRDYIEVPGELSMKTDDGAFDERWTVELRGQSAGTSSVALSIDWDALSGSFDFSKLVPEGQVALDGNARLSFSGDRPSNNTSGEIAGLSELHGPGDTVGAHFISVGLVGDEIIGDW